MTPVDDQQQLLAACHEAVESGDTAQLASAFADDVVLLAGDPLTAAVPFA